MKVYYDTFEELADAFTEPHSITHLITCKHSADDCLGWQRGVRDFAKALDRAMKRCEKSHLTNPFKIIEAQEIWKEINK